MTHVAISIRSSDDDIRKLVVEWSEAIARGDFESAVAMFPSDGDWTPELLRKTIQGYGVPDIDAVTLASMLEEWEVDEFRITTIFSVTNPEEFIHTAIDVDRESLYGLDPRQYLGMVHYNDVPLSGHVSDLTARFHIKKVAKDKLTLEFLDIHVM
jgi:hypothetical protein